MLCVGWLIARASVCVIVVLGVGGVVVAGVVDAVVVVGAACC